MDSILNKLDYWAGKNPDKLLYSFLDVNGKETARYTYAEFIRRTNIIAGNLQRDYHLAKNDRMLLAYPPGLEMICAFFACIRIGVIPVPVYPPTSYGFEGALSKMAYIAKDCQAVGVLTSKDYYWSIKLNLMKKNISKFTFRQGILSRLKWIITEDYLNLAEEDYKRDHSDILFLQYTSGSTSNPKGVMVSHSNILHNGEIVVDHMPVCVSWLPQYHDMGLIGYYLYTIIKGGTNYGFSPLDFISRPALWMESITRYRATASSAPNFAYDFCLRPKKISAETMSKLDLSSLRFLMTAAEPVRISTYERFLATFKPCGLNPESHFAAYGLAENTLAVSNYGRRSISVNQNSLKLNKVRVTTEVSEIASATRVMSCGKPLKDNIVKIVDPDNQIALEENNVGEIWVSGPDKCLGYWNNPGLTEKVFGARISGENHHGNTYLRTGDLGFMHQGELYICGRLKDMIIIRGLNFYPQDIEKIVEESSDLVRKGCVVAFDVHEDDEEKLVVLAEVRNTKTFPEPEPIVAAIGRYLNIKPHAIAFIAPKTTPKTSSGKVARHKAKENWLNGSLEILHLYTEPTPHDMSNSLVNDNPILEILKGQYNLSGNESHSLVAAGLDSVDLVVLMHEIQELLKQKGADTLATKIDIGLVQKISVAEIFELANEFENASATAVLRLKNLIERIQKEHREFERNLMTRDVFLSFEPAVRLNGHSHQDDPHHILLTGGTGFFGPFLLKSLLEQTNETLYVLVRAESSEEGKKRLRESMNHIGEIPAEIGAAFDRRVIPVCGDLGKTQLGLTKDQWDYLAGNIRIIYHNGATVNYLLDYQNMRSINVFGTNEILKLAFEGCRKVFNHVSTTFIFGWAVKDTLFESDTNQDLDLLDFGYSQTKWVSEQIVKHAMKKGLQARIFRPALITPSAAGGGNNFDISIRLIAFMIKHGIGVDTHNQVSFLPADVAANNIVAISNVPDTLNRTFHVTRDDYYNMMDITNMISRLTGKEFDLFKLKDFVPEVIKRCTKDDLLYPLLDFLVRSVDNISTMEFKRYDSSNYREARNTSKWGRMDPSLEDTVNGMLLFMHRNEIIYA